MKNIVFERRRCYQLSPELEQKRLREIIRRELSPLQQETLLACYFQGKNITQLARERGVCPSTVSRTLNRALGRIGKFLQY